MVVFVSSAGNLSIDYYSQQLAKQLPIEAITSQYFVEALKRRAASSSTGFDRLKGLMFDIQTLREFRKINGIPHFSNQHFGRFGVYLNKPYLITCHDIIRYLDMHNETVLQKRPKGVGRLYLELDFKGVQKADNIIAISAYTKKELVSKLGIKDKKIEVIPLGVDRQVFYPRMGKDLPSFQYILYAGSEMPRKNFQLLLEAFYRIKKRNQNLKDLKLVKVGTPDDTASRTATIAKIKEWGLTDEVIFTGRIPDNELAQFYSKAECFVFPSLYEGFGLPPLEAMACGCPVITSNTTSLPEVVGDAGVLIDPTSVDQLVEALENVLSDSSMRKEMRLRGIARSKDFSWESCAKKTCALYEREGYLTSGQKS